MIAHVQAAVWIDHHEARIFHVGGAKVDESTLAAPRHLLHRHEKGATEEHPHPDDQRRFFRAVADGIRDAEQVLVMGPSTAKLQLLRYLHQQEHALEAKVVGVETVDHPTDRQLVAYVKRYFDESEPAAR